MLTRTKRSWEIDERQVTPEAVYLSRRAALVGIGGGLAGAALAGRGALAADEALVAAELYPAKRNDAYQLDRPLTEEKYPLSFNNFYEFGSDKQIASAAQVLKVKPWQVTFDGLVEKAQTIDAEDLIRKIGVEERLYRHRCVEAWSMAVPWSGFPMRSLVEFAKPTAAARYVKMYTFEDSAMAPGQKAFWYTWPYVEGLTIAEATNELAFIGTGIYGKPMPKQNGAPLRLVTPWKYGFKSIKSVVRFEFTAERPVSFWEELQSSEYGFWANVNPKVAHPRWSQATEEVLGTGERRPTLLFNGYGEQVAKLYTGLDKERLYV